MTTYIELTLSYLLKSSKGHDSKAFIKSAPFTEFPEPTIHISSTDCGPSGSTLPTEYMHGGEGKIPELQWDTVDGCKQWLIIVEDPDAPLPTPICHGIYLAIAASKTTFTNSDLECIQDTKLRGCYYGMNRRGVVYMPPRPLLNHGIHRYTFDVVALGEELDGEFVRMRPTREKVGEAIRGKVLGWGRWMGQCERRWE